MNWNDITVFTHIIKDILFDVPTNPKPTDCSIRVPWNIVFFLFLCRHARFQQSSMVDPLDRDSWDLSFGQGNLGDKDPGFHQGLGISRISFRNFGAWITLPQRTFWLNSVKTTARYSSPTGSYCQLQKTEMVKAASPQSQIVNQAQGRYCCGSVDIIYIYILYSLYIYIYGLHISWAKCENKIPFFFFTGNPVLSTQLHQQLLLCRLQLTGVSANHCCQHLRAGCELVAGQWKLSFTNLVRRIDVPNQLNPGIFLSFAQPLVVTISLFTCNWRKQAFWLKHLRPQTDEKPVLKAKEMKSAKEYFLFELCSFLAFTLPSALGLWPQVQLRLKHKSLVDMSWSMVEKKIGERERELASHMPLQARQTFSLHLRPTFSSRPPLGQQSTLPWPLP